MPSDQPTYAPMLAGTSQGVPAGDGWRFEIKWDGFRAIARVHGDDVQLLSRNGKRLDGTHGDVAAALPRALTHSDCVLDGELCAFDETAFRASSCSSAARARSRTSSSTCSSSTASR